MANSRQLKFRAWDKKNIQMLYDWITINKDYTGALSGNYCDMEDIMQFTGLHDKNGKEIYEGDIIQGNYWKGHTNMEEMGQIKWNNNESCYEIEWIKGDTYGATDSLHLIAAFEVIGNIYENKELLNADRNSKPISKKGKT